jgi:hypothetical protein
LKSMGSACIGSVQTVARATERKIIGDWPSQEALLTQIHGCATKPYESLIHSV